MLAAVRMLVLVTAACGPAALPVTPPLPKPACVATLADGHLAIDGKPTQAEVSTDADSKLVSWPHAGGLVVSWTTNAPETTPAGSEDVYTLDCGSHAASLLAHVDGADFGHAAADATTLYFTGPDGVAALDLATRQVRPVTHPAPSVECSGDEAKQLDVVTALHDDALDFDRYPGCAAFLFGAQMPYRLVHPSKGGEPRPVRPIGTVAVEAGGAIWAATPACQALVLWRSIDHGEHWARSQLPDDTTGGAVAIVADHAHVGQVVVEASYCLDPAQGIAGGRLYATRNAGHEWTPLGMPEDMQQLEDGVGSRLMLASRDGSVDALVITGDSTEGTTELASWLSTDGGKTWLRMPRPKGAPVMSTEARDGAWTYKTSPDGLVRVHDGKTETFYPL